MSLERWSIEGEDQPLLVHAQFEPVVDFQPFEPARQMSVLGLYLGSRVLIQVGVGLMEQRFHDVALLLPRPLQFLLSHRIAA
jgi:hypothetical protein